MSDWPGITLRRSVEGGPFVCITDIFHFPFGEELYVPVSEVRERLEPLLMVLKDSLIQVEFRGIPSDWPSVTCENPGHERRPTSGVDDWRCQDCGSTWWATDGTPMPDESHIEAFLYRFLDFAPDAAAFPDKEGG